jgi:diguanylate cyclase (GGDEF)-like protein
MDELDSLRTQLEHERTRTQSLEAEVVRLKQELEDLRLVYQSTVDHGTIIENELDQRVRIVTVQATTDPLTGIFNRLKFHDALNKSLDRRSAPKAAYSLIMFDIDRFKEVNDQHGHHVGDDVLVELIVVVRGAVRQDDIFARWGGEEFVILTAADGGDACRLAERIRATVETHQFKRVGQITCSFGVTAVGPGDNVESIIQRADTALYRAKWAGRNRVERE